MNQKLWAYEDKLKAQRQKRKLTLQEMADLLGIAMGKDLPMKTYEAIENGRRSVNWQTAIAISRALKMRPHELWHAKM